MVTMAMQVAAVCIIGANSMVLKDLPPDTIYTNKITTVMRSRFESM
jgi:serine acetyltransferase